MGIVTGLAGRGDRGEVHRRTAALLRDQVQRWRLRGHPIEEPPEGELAEGNLALARVTSAGPIFVRDGAGYFDVRVSTTSPIQGLRGGFLFNCDLYDADMGGRKPVATADGKILSDQRLADGAVAAVVLGGGRFDAEAWRAGRGNVVEARFVAEHLPLSAAAAAAIEERFLGSHATVERPGLVSATVPPNYWERPKDFIQILEALEIDVAADPRHPLLVYQPDKALITVLRTDYFEWKDPVNPWGTARVSPQLLLATIMLPGFNLNEVEGAPGAGGQRIIYRVESSAVSGLARVITTPASGGEPRAIFRSRSLLDVIRALDRAGLRPVDLQYFLHRLARNRQALDVQLAFFKPDPAATGGWAPYFAPQGVRWSPFYRDIASGSDPGAALRQLLPPPEETGDFQALVGNPAFQRLRDDISFRIATPAPPGGGDSAGASD